MCSLKYKSIYLYLFSESRFNSQYWGKNLRILCFLLMGFLFSGCALLESPPDPPKPVNLSGASGKLDPEAERLYGKARVLWGRAEVCSDPVQAVEYLDEAIRREPDYAEAYLRRGMALSEQGYADEAFEDLTHAIRLDPTPDAYAYRGLALLRQGNMKGARQDFDEAIRLAPESYRAWNFRGASWLQEGNDAAACEDFEEGCRQGDCSFLEKARDGKICQ